MADTVKVSAAQMAKHKTQYSDFDKNTKTMAPFAVSKIHYSDHYIRLHDVRHTLYISVVETFLLRKY